MTPTPLTSGISPALQTPPELAAQHKLHKAAQAFEGILIDTLWSGFEDDPLGADKPSDPGAQSLKGLGLQAMSNALAARGGLGLGTMIERQLSPHAGTENAAQAVESLKPLPAFADKLGVARLPGLAATENQR